MFRRSVLGTCVIAFALLLSACAAPLSVERLSVRDGYNELNRSALSGPDLSEVSLTALRRHDLFELWHRDPPAAIAALHRDVVGKPDSWSDLFSLAELSFAQGVRADSRPDFLASAIYAYAYLFPDDASAERPSPYDPRFRQACDLYNLGLTAAFTPPGGGPVEIRSGRRELPEGGITLDVAQDQFRWAGRTLISFQPTSNIAVEGMQNVYRHSGLGAPLAALTQVPPDQKPGFQIAPKLRVPTNMLLLMNAPRSQLSKGTELHGRLVIHTIFDALQDRIGDAAVPLEYNQTAARALSMVDASAWGNEYTGFLEGDLFARAPQLVALQPHQRGRMPVVLIHGTASSPFRWADMINDLLEVPAIRDNFEFWFFAYATGNPIPYSAFQLRRSIDQAVQELGGIAADPALGRMTLIGHSQGGLLAKMLVIDPGDRLWNAVSRRPIEQLRLSPESRALARETMFPKPLPYVQRVVFIATPQRGSYAAAYSISRLVQRLVTLPLSVTKLGAELLTGNADALADPSRTGIGSVYGMSPGSPFIKALAPIPVVPDVHAHSIIPVETHGPLSEASDGVVRYTSAHIDGVDSEVIVHSGHSAQSDPATIAEVRRLLLLQLAASRPPAALPPVAQLQ